MSDLGLNIKIPGLPSYWRLGSLGRPEWWGEKFPGQVECEFIDTRNSSTVQDVGVDERDAIRACVQYMHDCYPKMKATVTDDQIEELLALVHTTSKNGTPNQ